MKANQYIREVETVFKKNTNPQIKVKSSKDAYNLFCDLENSTQEKLIALHLATDNSVVCFQVVHIGTLNEAFCNPADIFRTALLTGATSLIVLHNHPSGDPTPSPTDREMFNKIRQVAEVHDIKVFDLIIIGKDNYYSAADSDELKL